MRADLAARHDDADAGSVPVSPQNLDVDLNLNLNPTLDLDLDLDRSTSMFRLEAQVQVQVDVEVRVEVNVHVEVEAYGSTRFAASLRSPATNTMRATLSPARSNTAMLEYCSIQNSELENGTSRTRAPCPSM